MATRPSRDDFALFNMELANLVRSGLPLSEGLRHVAKEVRSESFRREIGKIEQRLDGGMSLSDALAEAPHIFSSYYLTLVKAGERSGSLAEVLFHLTRYARFQARAFAKIKTGLAYPLIVFVIALTLVCSILVFIVPRFQELYAGAGAHLPALTDLIVRLSVLIRFHTLETLVVIAGVAVTLWLLARYAFRPAWDAAKLYIPIVGRMSKASLLVHYCEVVGYMLKQGIPIVDALRIAAGTTNNVYASGAFDGLASRVEAGGRLSTEMQGAAFFPPSLVWMVSAAEDQERVDEVLQDASALYMDQIDDWSDRFSGIVEPFLILFLGLTVGIIVIGLYMPLFKVGDVIK